jgi:tRNA (guanine37-N1)-methyltransferase
MFSSFLNESIVRKALKKNAVEIRITDIRDFTFNKNRQADDYPYGGGAGMVMKPEPIASALDFVLGKGEKPVIYFTPQGRLLKQNIVREFSKKERIVLLCGHYKEIDQRIRDIYVTDEISVGDYVLSGGEIPAMIMIDALVRLQKNVLNDFESALTDSHTGNLLGCPHYTRPNNFMGYSVPEILKSGNHKKIEEWRNKKAMEITKKRRPDLLENE